MFEAVAAAGAGVGAVLAFLDDVLDHGLGRILGAEQLDERFPVAVAIPVAVAVAVLGGGITVLGGLVIVLLVVRRRSALDVADQRGQLAGECVDLVAAQRRARGQLGLRIGQDAVEAEDQREVAAPLVAGRGRPPVHLGEGSVERRPPSGSRGERHLGGFAFV